MIKRNTIVMVVLLAVLAGLAYYLQQPDNLIKKALPITETPTGQPLGGTLLPANAGPLSRLSIQSADGQSVTLDRKSAGWVMTLGSTSSIPADQGASEEYATEAVSMTIAQQLNSVGADLSVYGLDKPSYVVKCTISDGSTVTIKIGKATVTGSTYYLQKQDGSIVVVDKSAIDNLLNALKTPPYMFTPTPSPAPAPETATPTPTSAVITTETSITELTPTKQP
jgi:hypothetical protein